MAQDFDPVLNAALDKFHAKSNALWTFINEKKNSSFVKRNGEEVKLPVNLLNSAENLRNLVVIAAGDFVDKGNKIDKTMSLLTGLDSILREEDEAKKTKLLATLHNDLADYRSMANKAMEAKSEHDFEIATIMLELAALILGILKRLGSAMIGSSAGTGVLVVGIGLTIASGVCFFNSYRKPPELSAMVDLSSDIGMEAELSNTR